ncbi:hypothetical protein C731_4961 [Mycolicibacterium hassiacum DSM 44199]|uniref:Uncharacterized protein n=1 Tax=Mycolicibacterium hassiacum (strain DSM 44199 / CIP 105218 / JCM 12690 / 3849) TaxID=1122247 RepID=K5BIC1_MYCHD|nr:hypothetical protein C731_4961 [Mycolicibacterium hassiacum DSM 44199]
MQFTFGHDASPASAALSRRIESSPRGAHGRAVGSERRPRVVFTRSLSTTAPSTPMTSQRARRPARRPWFESP